MTEPEGINEMPANEPEGGTGLEAVRELILSSHSNVVPELVQGDSIDSLIASIEPARNAYSRIAEAVPQNITIPAGGNAPIVLDADQLPTSEKIRRGLAANRK